jgi:hypothetical protein
MKEVYKIVKEKLACFQPICDILKDRVQNGQAVSMLPLKLDGNGSLLDKIMEAVKAYEDASDEWIEVENMGNEWAENGEPETTGMEVDDTIDVEMED